jgi:hypothetical protein
MQERKLSKMGDDVMKFFIGLPQNRSSGAAPLGRFCGSPIRNGCAISAANFFDFVQSFLFKLKTAKQKTSMIESQVAFLAVFNQ